MAGPSRRNPGDKNPESDRRAADAWAGFVGVEGEMATPSPPGPPGLLADWRRRRLERRLVAEHRARREAAGGDQKHDA